MASNDGFIAFLLLGGISVFAWTQRCKWWPKQFTCDNNAYGLSAADGYTGGDLHNPAGDNGYGNTRINTNPNAKQNAAKKIAQQNNFDPSTPNGAAAAHQVNSANSKARQNSFCTPANKKLYPQVCASSNYANAFYSSYLSHTLQSVRI